MHEPTPRDRFERRALCATCRTLLAAGEPCDAGGDHEVLALGTPEDRARVRRAVWDEAPRYETRRSDGWGGALVGGVLGLIGIWALYSLLYDRRPPVLALKCATFLFAVVGYCVAVFRARRVIGTVRRPRRATRRPRMGMDGSIGTVVADDRPPSEPCARLVILKLAPYQGGGVTLRDAWSEGFEVELADGQRVHVPAGRIRLDGPRRSERELPEDEIEAHLRRVDPLRAPGARGEPDDLFPYVEGRVIALRPGDRVKIVGEIGPDVAHEPGTYRVPAPLPRVRPRGVPHLRFLREARRAATPGAR
ncbi:hypothetical protein [Sorangium sp. So ce1182]|uniref:hypothetical protein n=1 Tax=Sorangium sp. So ce1182 TaxID=3133334 RepID=UPI003F6420DC